MTLLIARPGVATIPILCPCTETRTTRSLRGTTTRIVREARAEAVEWSSDDDRATVTEEEDVGMPEMSSYNDVGDKNDNEEMTVSDEEAAICLFVAQLNSKGLKVRRLKF